MWACIGNERMMLGTGHAIGNERMMLPLKGEQALVGEKMVLP